MSEREPRTAAGPASERRSHPFAVACSACGVEGTAESANELIAFARRHRRHTGHELTWTRADVEFELPAEGDLETVVAALERRRGSETGGTDGTGRTDGTNGTSGAGGTGVPIGLVAAAMGEQGYAVGETLETIREVRLTGALYEPRDDHVAVV